MTSSQRQNSGGNGEIIKVSFGVDPPPPTVPSPSPWIRSSELMARWLLAGQPLFFLEDFWRSRSGIASTAATDQEHLSRTCSQVSGRFAPDVGRELGPLFKTLSLAPVRDRTPRRSPAQSVYFGVGCQRLSDRSSWTTPCCRRINVALLPHSRLFVSFHLHAGRQLSLAAPEALWLPSNTRFTQSLHSKARRGGWGGGLNVLLKEPQSTCLSAGDIHTHPQFMAIPP